MLMALGEPLPKQVFAHPWLLFGTDKMSKSRGNVIYADDLVKLIGVDAVRYYLLSEMPYTSDGSITYETVFERYNSDLANTLGNLVNRTVAMNNKYFNGEVMAPTAKEPVDDELKAAALNAVENVENLLSEYRISDALEAVLSLARRSNKYIDETAPWVLAKDENQKARLGTVLYNLLESIRYIAILISPFMPETAEKIFEQLNSDVKSYDSLKEFGGLQTGTKVGTATPLFSRLDSEKLLADIAEAAKKAQELEKPKKEIEEKPQITIDDFAKVELRVAKVTDCEPVKRAKKLLKLTLNDGVGERTVASGIAQYYKPEDLIGHNVILVANLKPAKLCGVESCGMILAADSNDSVKVIFADDMEVGSTVR